MSERTQRVCPVERAGSLDNRIRRWLQNPQKMLRPYINDGMTVLDLGCGPGFFTLDMAQMVGESGRVIASDLQQGMLQKVGDKIKGTEFEDRITLHKCEENRIGVATQVDFMLLFYIVHEVSNQDIFFNEIKMILNPDGKVLMVEPSFHVPKSAFEKTVRKALAAGFKALERPKLFFSKAVVLKKS